MHVHQLIAFPINLGDSWTGRELDILDFRLAAIVRIRSFPTHRNVPFFRADVSLCSILACIAAF